MNSFPSHKSQNHDLILSQGGSSSLTTRQDLKPEDTGIKLIQLFLTCANHASSGNLQRADACLQQISNLASITGDPIQRLAARFASALAIRLIKRWPGLFKALKVKHTVCSSFDIDQARSMFRQSLPYIGFSYAVMNRTLIQAMSGEQLIHVVDLGSGDPNLWMPFLQGLAGFAPEVQRNPNLRITCVHSDMVVLGRLGVELSKEAQSLNMPLQFNPLQIGLRELKLEMLNVRPDETLAFTSFLNLHIFLAEDYRINAHFTGLNKNDGIRDSKPMAEFLKMVGSLKPKVLVVEQESDHNKIRLLDRFVEGLHFYSAIFDSISTSFGGSRSEERIAIEEMLGKEIENIVACEGLEREERQEPFAKWTMRFAQAGFRPNTTVV